MSLGRSGDLHGLPRRPKVVQGLSKGTQKEPKVGPRSKKVGRRAPKGGQQSNKSQNYIHINEIYANSRSTAIQRPASNNNNMNDNGC